MTKDVIVAQRELLHRIQTEGVQLAYETALAICRNDKAPAPAKANAAATLFRIAGYFDRKDAGANAKEPHEMTPEEIALEIDRLKGAFTARQPGIFD